MNPAAKLIPQRVNSPKVLIEPKANLLAPSVFVALDILYLFSRITPSLNSQKVDIGYATGRSFTMISGEPQHTLRLGCKPYPRQVKKLYKISKTVTICAYMRGFGNTCCGFKPSDWY